MNKEAQDFFDSYLAEAGIVGIVKVDAWQFGAKADFLAERVVEGKKTGTCSLYKLYEIDNEPLPEVGQYDVILDSNDHPVALIQNVDVTILKMNKVSESFALSEGEGTYKEWWDAHVNFFSEAVKEYNETFTTEDLLVCETFKCVKVNR